ncbi:U3 small nucleolar RNA-associated protein 4 homolog [Saccoglossus kowalevskii]|uniref:Cirhin-like n=1 Tax=Saccoglossus kowalevskii TaxID=10224 RepID=A0ABM0M301_SACKO|nr:PREDICTED: cirhin-like [Saccoglossus kowalevskii]
MGDFCVHLVRFFNYTPSAIHCLAYEESIQRLAVSRSDSSVEIWSRQDGWYHEKTVPGCEGRSVEALTWVNSRLFSAGLYGGITEYDLMKIEPRITVDSLGGAVWCMTTNASRTHIAESILSDVNPMYSKKKSGSKAKHLFKRWILLPFPQHKHLVHLAADADVIMFQFSTHLELWMLGATSRTSKTDGDDGDVLPLLRKPSKLLELKAKGNDQIVCSAISKCGSWIVYSDITKIRMYHITMDTPSVTKVAGLPSDLSPAHCMMFTRDSSKLIIGTRDCTVQIVQVDNLQPVILHTFSAVCQPIHLLSVTEDGCYVAVGNHASQINVYNIEAYTHHCSLPQLSTQPCSMGFSPHNSMLMVVYCNQKIVEYDITKKEYSNWSKASNHSLSKMWKLRQGKVMKIGFSPTNPNMVILQAHDMFAVIDKTKSNITEKITGNEDLHNTKSGKKEAVFCHKYNPLLFLDALKDNVLVAVERPRPMMLESLPESLKMKKFGT